MVFIRICPAAVAGLHSYLSCFCILWGGRWCLVSSFLHFLLRLPLGLRSLLVVRGGRLLKGCRFKFTSNVEVVPIISNLAITTATLVAHNNTTIAAFNFGHNYIICVFSFLYFTYTFAGH